MANKILTKSELESLKPNDKIKIVDSNTVYTIDSVHKTKFNKIRLRVKYFCNYGKRDRFHNIIIGSTFKANGTQVIRSESSPGESWERRYVKVN
jgi:hypothetical protein